MRACLPYSTLSVRINLVCYHTTCLAYSRHSTLPHLTSCYPNPHLALTLFETPPIIDTHISQIHTTPHHPKGRGRGRGLAQSKRLVMRWGSSRSPHLLARCKALSSKTSSRPPFHQWYSSGRGGLSIVNPNIAAVLATPPSTESQPGEQITVVGFVRTIRNQKLRSFVEVGDGSTVYPLQAVLEPLQAKGSVSRTCLQR